MVIQEALITDAHVFNHGTQIHSHFLASKLDLIKMGNSMPISKLYTPSTINIDLILWQTQWIVCAVK